MGVLLGCLGEFFERLEAIWARLGTFLGRLGLLRPSSEPPRPVFDVSWALLAARWREYGDPVFPGERGESWDPPPANPSLFGCQRGG